MVLGPCGSRLTERTGLDTSQMMSLGETSVEKIILAEPRGFCAGVDRAVEAVRGALRSYGRPLYVRHQIVHNRFVLEALEREGAIFVDSLDAVPEGQRVIFSAHGVAPSEWDRAKDRRAARYRCDLSSRDQGPRRSRAIRQRRAHRMLVGHQGARGSEGHAWRRARQSRAGRLGRRGARVRDF